MLLKQKQLNPFPSLMQLEMQEEARCETYVSDFLERRQVYVPLQRRLCGFREMALSLLFLLPE